MSAQKIQAALGQLQDDPENELAWAELAEAVTSPHSEAGHDELKPLLEAARRAYETRRQWDAVARILELEATLHAGTPVELAMQFELSRVLDEECFETSKAEAAYERLLALRPSEPSAKEALERLAHGRTHWKQLEQAHLEEARATADASLCSSRLSQAAEILHRFGETEEDRARALRHLEEALELSPKNERAAALLERIHRAEARWEEAARTAELIASYASTKESRVAALLRIAHLSQKQLGSEGRASAAYERVLDLAPGQVEAMAYLVNLFSKNEQWDHLVALYEDQLRGGGAGPGEETGIIFQIAMVNWKMREDARAAEPWFDRLRRLQPAHPGVLGFFRERGEAEEGRFRLMTVLSDAQRAMPDGPERAKLAVEIAKLAEEGSNAQKAIEQYKTVLREEPENHEALRSLKRLYVKTEGWNALIELLRQELERVAPENAAERAVVLREIAAVYRDHIKSDTALVTVLSQLVQLDETDLSSLRELVRTYEALGRFRDLLQHQSKLARALPEGDEKAALLRSVARRWFEQFSNVQNATEAYEALLAAEPNDEEALSKLRELYLKRRAFSRLYSLYERELTTKVGAERWELLGEMAKLAADRLDRGADAIRLYKEILANEPSRLDILDQLERQAEREKDFATLAEALEKRLETTTDESSRIALLQKLGTVHGDKLGDHAQAARAFRRVLEIQPGHGRALRVLRDAYLAGGDYDGLEELYASQGDWEGLAEVLSNAADRAEEPELKIALSFRAARVFVEELGSRERAFRSYERVLSVRPDDRRAATELLPLYENDEKWARLPALYEVLLAHADDSEKLGLFEKLIEVTGKRLNDAEAALAWAHKAHEFSPSEATLEAFEAASRAAKSWDAYIATVEALLVKKGKKKPKPAEKRALHTRLAKLYESELGRIDEAVASYRALVEDRPDDTEAIESLDRLLRASDRRDDLRWLFDWREANAKDAETKAELLAELAALEEDAFGEAARAKALYLRALDALPGHLPSLRALSRLLLAADDASGAAELLEAHRDFVHGEAGAMHELALSDLYLDSLERPADALTCITRALELSPGDSRAMARLQKLLAFPETRARAASMLEREYAASGEAGHEAEALAIQLETTEEPNERLEIFNRLSELHATKLHAIGDALDLLMQALSELPSELTLWDRAEELAARSGRGAELAGLYAAAVEKPLPEVIETELSERAAKLHDEKLGDPKAAVPYFERLLAHRPDDERAFARLKQILTSYEKWADLEKVYARAAEATADPSRRVELFNEVALVCEEITNDPAKAAQYYERILALEPLHELATRGLDRLYPRLGQFTKLAAFLEQRLDTAPPEETLSLKLRLGRLHLEQLGDAARALVHLESVLELDAKNLEARELIERALDIPELRSRAALSLEPAYDAHDDARGLVRVLEIRLETEDEAGLRELLHRIADLRDERLADERGAFDAYTRLLPLDPNDDAIRQRMVELGRRLGEHARLARVLEEAASHARSPDLASEILLEVARLHEDFLGDTDRAETFYKRALEIDPNHAQLALPAARELERLYVASGRHADLAAILQLASQLEDDPDAKRGLLFRLGELYETVLDEPARAIATLRLVLDSDPSDDQALAALQELYERTSAFAELAQTAQIRADFATDPESRHALLLKRARILTTRLADDEQALSAWQSLYDELGPERETLTALSSLHEKAERWDDLVAVLEAELALEEDPSARLELLARLGELRHRRQADWASALEALRQALTLNPSHARSRAALEAMIDVPEARREVAELLHPLYEADGDSERLLGIVELEIESEDDDLSRLALLEKAVGLAEGPLSDPARAFDHALQALRTAVGEADHLPSWLERAEALAARTSRFHDFVPALRELVSEILDGETQLEVTLKIAEIAETKLEDLALARESYTRALDLRDDEPRALSALDSLYERTGDMPALLDILRRRIDCTLDETSQKSLLYRKARLLRSQGDLEGAIAAYESIVDIAVESEAVSALDELYAKTERWGDVVALYERQLDFAGEGRPSLYVRIAKVVSDKLFDRERAFDSIEEALRIDAHNEPAIAFLEGLLEESSDPDSRARAAEMLEPIYLRRADYRRVIATLDARLSASLDSHERRPLLQRLANLQEAQAEDYPAALETTAKLFHEDIADKETRSELERLAKAAGREARLAEIYASELAQTSIDDESLASLAERTGELYASQGELDRALDFYRRALAFEPESRAVFDAIDTLLKRANRSAERAELHREALEHRYEPGLRVATLHALAKIERDELADLDKAIEAYRAVLEIDDRDERALDALTTLFRERKQFVDLAELYELRADSAKTAVEASGYRLLLARLYRDDLAEPSTALDWYEQLIHDGPSDRGAVSDLEALARGSEHAERAVEILRSYYERADDWRRLVAINGQRFGLAESDSEKLAILRETARLWEDRGQDLERAMGALGQALEVEPDDGEIRADLLRVVEILGAWDDLATIYEKVLPSSQEPLVQQELLLTLAQVHDERRGDLRAALGSYLRLVALDESDPEPLDCADELALLLGDWRTLSEVVEKKASLTHDDSDRVSLLRRVAEIRHDMLEDEDGAIAAYEQALELDAEDALVLDRLLALYEPKNDAARLVDLYSRRIEVASMEESELRHRLLLASATRFEDDLQDRREAIDCLHRALEIHPNETSLLSRIARLLRAERLWPELLETLELKASLAEAPAERTRIRKEIGGLHATHLEDPTAALEAYRLVLDEAPSDDEAARAVMDLGKANEDLRLEVAEALEPVLRATAKWEMLVEALELRLSAEAGPEERARTRQSIATTLDEHLARPSEALALLLGALSETPEDAILYGELERLAALSENSGGWKRYADALEERASSIDDAALARDLSTRLGAVSADKLDDPERAIASYTKALEQGGDDAEILARLDELYLRTDDHVELARVLERRIEIEDHPSDQADLLHRLAALQIEKLGAIDEGLLTLKLALEKAPDHAGARESLEGLAQSRERFEEIAEILEQVYRQQGDNDRLTSLFEKRISFATDPEARIRMRLDLARLLEDRTADTKRAQKILEDALAETPGNSTILAEIERLAAIHDGWESAARTLATALEGTSDLDPLVVREGWLKIAGWYDDKLRDLALAEPAYEKALAHDPDDLEILRALERARRVEGREKSLVETLRQIAELETDAPTKRELLREAKAIATKIEDAPLAEAILRQLLHDDDADLWALEELTRIRDGEGDSKEVVALLLRRADLVDDSASVALRHEAAKLAHTRLDDPTQAIELLEGILDTDAADPRAGRSLRELYTETKRDSELAKLLARLVQVATTSSERASLRVELAKVQAERLDSPSDAIETLRAVLEEDPGHGTAVVHLSGLYESAHRDEDLAELLGSQIALAKSRGDSNTELALTVRLAEMLESRMGDRAKAMEAYRAVLVCDPSHRDALQALAKLHREAGEGREAATLLETLLGLVASDEKVAQAQRLADLYSELGDDEGVRRTLEKALETEPTHAEIRLRLAELYEKTGAFGSLAELLAEDAERASALDEKLNLYRRAAELHLNKRGDAVAAALLLEKATALTEDDRELLLLLCDAYSASGRGKDAATALEKIVMSFAGRRTKELANVHFRLSRAYLAEGDTSRALTELDQAFRIDPGSIAILKELGTLSLTAGDLERAQRTFRALLLQKLEPGGLISKGEVFYYLGEISRQLGDQTKAVQMLERALENEATLEKARTLLESLKK